MPPIKEVRQSFSYTTGWVTIAAAVGATAQFTIAIRADADFESVYLCGNARQAGLIVVNWSGLVQVNDPGAGRDLFNQAVPFDAIAGTGRDPYYFQPPRRWRSNSSLVVTFTNSVATATDVHLTFHGNKLFPEGFLAEPTQV